MIMDGAYDIAGRVRSILIRLGEMVRPFLSPLKNPAANFSTIQFQDHLPEVLIPCNMFMGRLGLGNGIDRIDLRF